MLRIRNAFLTTATTVLVATAALAPRALAQPAPAMEADAWALYDKAFAQVTAGKEAEALPPLTELRARFPDTAAGALGAALERYVASKQAGALVPPDLALRARYAGLVQSSRPQPVTTEEYLRNEAPTTGARIELAVVQGLFGLTSGAGTMQAFGLSTQVRVAGGVVGSVGGIAASLLLTRDGITPGHALAINSGAAWGFVGGLSLRDRIGREQAATAALAVVGHLGGAALGHLAWSKLALSTGDVALANSGALWSIGLLRGFAGSGSDLRSKQVMTTAGAIAGLSGGLLLSRYVPMSRTRVLLLDLGGVGGALAGLTVSMGFERGGRGSYVAGGSLAGLALAAFLTRRWDAPAMPLAVGLTPTDGGAVVTLALTP